MKTKICSRCKKELPVEHFGITNKGYYRSLCKPCSVIYSMEYAEKNPEKKSIANKLYYQRHKEQHAEYGKLWRENNLEYKRYVDRQYTIEHAEENRKRARDYYWNNRDKILECRKKYCIDNKEAIKKRKSKYSKEHRIERRAREHTRRTQKKINGGTYTKKQWIDLCNKYNNTCLMCGKTNIKLTVDHIIPISKGGSNYIDNIQPLCLSCNSKKHDHVIDLRVKT